MKEIFKDIDYRIINEVSLDGLGEVEYDSRKIEDDGIFIALTGSSVDGHDYIEKAIQNGAKLIICERELSVPKEVGLVIVEDLRKHLGIIASNYYGWPQKKLKIVGITGTNGKTTTTYILEKIFGEKKVARVGTVEYKIGKRVIPAPNTTPESLDVVKLCRDAIKEGIEYFVIEVSSHALEMGRVDMITFDSAIFTNLTIDHLDFHKTVEAYFNAKRKLFLKLKDSNSGIYNIEDEYGLKLYNEFGGLSYAGEKSDIEGKVLGVDGLEQVMEVIHKGNKYTVKSKLLGRFNMLNILGAIGAALKLGIKFEDIIEGIESIEGVPGRFEVIDNGQDFKVIVDFAHTGDALEKILSTLREMGCNNIITIFGCGGNKGIDKRFGMGRAARNLSDYTILTADNPRTEPIENIMADIEKAFVDKDGRKELEKYEIITDRSSAIQKALTLAKKGDIVLIAGKGHETSQTIGTKKMYYSDREEARTLLNKMFS